MKRQRVSIVLTFEADLDPVPGWGHEPRHWEQYVRDRLSGNDHYHPETTVLSIDLVGPPDPTAAMIANYIASGGTQ